MKYVALGTSLLFAVAPALAETASHPAGAPAAGSPQAAPGTPSAAAPGTPGSGGMVQEQLIHSLQQAGFTHVRVEPEAFVVHALNPQGQPVLMRITPDAVEAVTAVPVAPAHAGNGVSGDQGHASNAARSGTTTQ